jgi:lipoprotein-anchoring transpeptidase ErfK/SrfK
MNPDDQNNDETLSSEPVSGESLSNELLEEASHQNKTVKKITKHTGWIVICICVLLIGTITSVAIANQVFFPLFIHGAITATATTEPTATTELTLLLSSTPTYTPTPTLTPSPTAIPTKPKPTVKPKPTATPTPVGPQKTIVVSISKQWLWAYEDDKSVFDTAVATGQPGLDTPLGTYSIHSKQSPKGFHSPWLPEDPNWYPDFTAQYAMYFRDGGYYFHDYAARQIYGPGSNVPHTLADGTTETGTHGCVNVPLGMMQKLYQWAYVGTIVKITD